MFLKKIYLFILLHVSERDYRYMCDTDAYVEVRGQLRPSPLLKQGPSCFSYFHLPSCFRSGITHVFMWVPGVKLRLFRLVQLAPLPMEASSWPCCVFFHQSESLCVDWCIKAIGTKGYFWWGLVALYGGLLWLLGQLVILSVLAVLGVHWFAVLDMIDPSRVLFCSSVIFMDCVLSCILLCETVVLHYLKNFLHCWLKCHELSWIVFALR